MTEPKTPLEKLFPKEPLERTRWHWEPYLWLSLALLCLGALAWHWLQPLKLRGPSCESVMVVCLAGYCLVQYRHAVLKRSWETTATRLLFRYKPEGTEEDFLAIPSLALWEGNQRNRIKHLLGGPWQGLDTLVFDWQCVPMEGIDNGTTVVLFLGVPQPLPPFRLAAKASIPEMEKCVENREGALNLGLGRNETFVRNYRVESCEEEKTGKLFNHRVQGYLAQHPTWTVESCDGWLAVYRIGQRLEAGQVKDRLNKAVEILRLFMDDRAE